MSNPFSTDWRKSTHSQQGDGNCVEVATDWRKSTRSQGGDGDCVEVAAIESAQRP